MKKFNLMVLFAMVLNVSLLNCQVSADPVKIVHVKESAKETNEGFLYSKKKSHKNDQMNKEEEQVEEMAKADEPSTPTVKVTKENQSSMASTDLQDGYSKATLALPTGNIDTSTVLIQKHFPVTAKLGKPYTYIIELRNLSNLPLTNVKIVEKIPYDFEIVTVDPEYKKESNDRVVWKFDLIAPNSSVFVKYKGQSNDKTAMPCCTTAEYDPPSIMTSTMVLEPKMTIDLQVPSERMACEQILLEFAVKNTGDSVLKDVKVVSQLPLGVIDAYGSNDIEINAGSFQLNESKLFKVNVKAEKPGMFAFKVKAINEDASASSSVAKTRVVKPELTLSAKVNRTEQFIGRDLKYDITVKNSSEVEAKDVVVRGNIPTNTKFKSATHDGFRSGAGTVNWEVGTLKPYETKKVSLVLESIHEGKAKAEFQAKAHCCDEVNSTVNTQLSGIPALMLEVVDIIDPLEVGETNTYLIKVTNQGTADAHNIKIVADFAGRDFVSDTGSSYGSVLDEIISFDTVTRLAPTESANWRVRVSGRETGDLRFHVTLTSDELTTPVEESESTYVY